MKLASITETIGAGPKRREKHHLHDESANEPATLIEDEATEIEQGVPADDTQPVEQIDKDSAGLPAFEE